MPSLAKFQAQFLREVLGGKDPAYAVYRNNVRLTLIALLGTIYPVCKKLVGAAFFDGMASVFVKEHVPQSGNMHVYGGAFADFITGFAPAATLPYLPDVVRLEWAWHSVYYGADRAVVASAYPIMTIWQANQSDDMNEIYLDEGGQTVCVYREDGGIVMKVLEQN